MAHHISVKVKPHTNQDGTPSKAKKDYLIIDRTRGKKVEVALITTQKAIEPAIEAYRGHIFRIHDGRHPNDMAFKAKHKVA